MAFKGQVRRLEQLKNVAATGVVDGETLVHDAASGKWVAGTGAAAPAGTVNRQRFGALAARPAADGTQGVWFDTDTNPPTQYLDTGSWQPIGVTADEVTQRALIFGG